MAEVAKEDILFFIHDKGEVRYTDLIKEFVDSGKCAKQTLINYKLQLESSGRLQKKISKKTNRPIYYIPDEFKKEIETLLAKKRIHGFIDAETDLEYLRIAYKDKVGENKQLKEEIDKLKKVLYAVELLI